MHFVSIINYHCDIYTCIKCIINNSMKCIKNDISSLLNFKKLCVLFKLFCIIYFLIVKSQCAIREENLHKSISYYSDLIP